MPSTGIGPGTAGTGGGGGREGRLVIGCVYRKPHRHLLGEGIAYRQLTMLALLCRSGRHGFALQVEDPAWSGEHAPLVHRLG
jgi:hypothetical protein